MTDARRAELEPYFADRAFMPSRELLEVRAELDRARKTEEAQRDVIDALANALKEERVLSGVHGCQCRESYICVTCRGTKALDMLAALSSTT